MDEILPFLYVGTQAAAEDLPYLSQYGVSYILNVSESSSGYPPQFEVLHIPLSDFGDSNLADVFGECFAFIDNAYHCRAKILVHCQVGVNRSPSVVMAYLMQHVPCDLLTSCRTVKQRRPGVFPVEPYLQQLLKYEASVRSSNSCTIEDLLAVLRSNCFNLFTAPHFRGFQQHTFGNESEQESDDEQPEFGAESSLPLRTIQPEPSLWPPGEAPGGTAPSKFALNFMSIPRLEERTVASQRSALTPTSPPPGTAFSPGLRRVPSPSVGTDRSVGSTPNHSGRQAPPSHASAADAGLWRDLSPVPSPKPRGGSTSPSLCGGEGSEAQLRPPPLRGAMPQGGSSPRPPSHRMSARKLSMQASQPRPMTSLQHSSSQTSLSGNCPSSARSSRGGSWIMVDPSPRPGSGPPAKPDPAPKWWRTLQLTWPRRSQSTAR
jgi:hypothetical protein